MRAGMVTLTTHPRRTTYSILSYPILSYATYSGSGKTASLPRKQATPRHTGISLGDAAAREIDQPREACKIRRWVSKTTHDAPSQRYFTRRWRVRQDNPQSYRPRWGPSTATSTAEGRLGGPTDLQRNDTRRLEPAFAVAKVHPGLVTQSSHGHTPVMAMVGTLHHAEPSMGISVQRCWLPGQSCKEGPTCGEPSWRGGDQYAWVDTRGEDSQAIDQPPPPPIHGLLEATGISSVTRYTGSEMGEEGRGEMAAGVRQARYLYGGSGSVVLVRIRTVSTSLSGMCGMSFAIGHGGWRRKRRMNGSTLYTN